MTIAVWQISSVARISNCYILDSRQHRYHNRVQLCFPNTIHLFFWRYSFRYHCWFVQLCGKMWFGNWVLLIWNHCGLVIDWQVFTPSQEHSPHKLNHHFSFEQCPIFWLFFINFGPKKRTSLLKSHKSMYLVIWILRSKLHKLREFCWYQSFRESLRALVQGISYAPVWYFSDLELLLCLAKAEQSVVSWQLIKSLLM